MLALPFLEASPFQFGDLVDETLHFLVVGNGLADVGLPELWDAALAEFAGVALDEVEGGMAVALGAMTVGFAALAGAVGERAAEKPMGGGELGDAGAEGALGGGEAGAEEGAGHVLYLLLYKTEGGKQEENAMRKCSLEPKSLK